MAVFLSENGVLSMGNKTPVTILQETLQRKGIVPQYDLIYNGVGTLDPVFKYEVKYRISADTELSAIGSGKSKKEAKHDAAAALLRRMQPNRAVTENESVVGEEKLDIASPYTGALKQNFVGMLEEVCVINKVPNAEFILISEAGPPHARVFTMKCKVSYCSEIAVARTKKQAKHLVAQLMIARLAAILGELFIPPAEKSTEPDPELEDDLDQQRSMHFKAIESGSFRHDLSIRTSEKHNVFHHRMEEFIIPDVFLNLGKKPEKYYEDLEKPKEFLDELLNQLEGTCKIVPLSDSLIMEGLAEIDSIAKKFTWKEDDCYDSVKDFCADTEENQSEENNYNTEESEENALGKCILEEFLLDIPKDDRYDRFIRDKKLNSIDNSNDLKEVVKNEVIFDSVNEEFEKVCLNSSSGCVPVRDMYDLIETKENNAVRIFLSVICPQGQWAFWGCGLTLADAVNRAAISCLQFLRLMSIPSNYNDH